MQIMTIARNLREMSAEQLQFQLDEAQKALFDLRCKAASEKLETPSLVRRARREIARIKTVLRLQELAKV
ncbi:50S ribosomal protein L29 [Planctopirus ephydatiae]|jgi:large subunit ribosomal protein L29|uniref:Large ribosomal subunit protein uL29 n=2 Tax=Planctopirus ephydatiae TaxID=2528019 RepID=A0A518GL36_9PLAN|nr:50S ribosomal protein L29 [Planctopirus ephydatiae]